MNLEDTIKETIKKELSGQLDNILSVISDVEIALAKTDERLRKVETYLGQDLKNSVLTPEQARLSGSIKTYNIDARGSNLEGVRVTQTTMKVKVPYKKK